MSAPEGHVHVSKEEREKLCNCQLDEAATKDVVRRNNECLDCKRSWMAYAMAHSCQCGVVDAAHTE